MLKTTNNATGLLALPITDVETTLALQTGQGARFPTLAAGEYFPLTVVRAEDPTQFEIMRVTDRSGDTLTVTREQEGTTAITFSAGDIVELRLTSGAIQESFPQVVGSDAGSKGVEFDVAGVTAGQKRTVTVPDADVTLGQVASAGITDATTAGRTLLTAADAAAQKTALSLENVDNTADADKPISTATQAALDAQQTAIDGKQPTLVSGTNIKTVGGQSLLGSGNLALPAGGFSNLVVLTGSGNWTVPAGVTKIKVTAVGGGGGGSGTAPKPGACGGGGGGGGSTIGIIATTPGASISYSVGAAGGAGTSSTNGGSGGNTTFGALTAGGGAGGIRSVGGIAAGGTASGGDLNFHGQRGGASGVNASGTTAIGDGGNSLLGYGARASCGDTNSVGAAGALYGGGGAGGFRVAGTAQAGGSGAAGIIIVEY